MGVLDLQYRERGSRDQSSLPYTNDCTERPLDVEFDDRMLA